MFTNSTTERKQGNRRGMSFSAAEVHVLAEVFAGNPVSDQPTFDKLANKFTKMEASLTNKEPVTA